MFRAFGESIKGRGEYSESVKNGEGNVKWGLWAKVIKKRKEGS